jgi:ribonuclease P protein component
LKKKYRIKKSDDIQSLMKKKKTVGDGYFVIYFNKNHDQENFRFALSVPKKYGNAVDRNLMKRRLREVIKPLNINHQFDFFIIAKINSRTLKFKEVKNHIHQLLKKAKILKDGSYEKQE